MEGMTTKDLEVLLTERMDYVKQEKTAIKDAVDSLDTKIRTLVSGIGKVPNETEGEINAAMSALERTHSTTSQTSAQERQFMRDMEKLRLKKKTLQAYLKTQAEIDAMKSKKSSMVLDLQEKDNTITELQSGLRKVTLAQRLKCELTDLYEQHINVEESKMSRVVGKGGQNLRNIESECGASVDMDRVGGGIHIMGTRATIEAALRLIMVIVETAVEEFTLPDVTITVLFMDKSALVQAIQARYNVRFDISRSKNSCKITGLLDAVIAAKTEVLSIQCLRQSLILEAAFLPFIIGKAGANIAGIEEQNKVAVNLNKDTRELEIIGLKPNVLAAMAQVKNMIEVNKEVEETIRVEKHILLGCLIGAGGSIIKGINRDFGVRVETEGLKDEQFQTVKIRGTNGKVGPAKAHIQTLMHNFVSSTQVVEVPDEFMAVLLGKGGSSMKSLREKYADVNIDIDKNRIHIQSTDAAKRAAVKAEIDGVIELNFNDSVEMSEDCIIQLKSQRGYDLREELMGPTYNLKLFMDKENKFVKLRGLRLNVVRGIQKLQQFKDNFTTVKIPIHEEDYPIFFKNGLASEDSLIKSIETKHDIEILSVRKELCFVIRGSPRGVADAQAHIEGFLAGRAEFGAVLTPLDTLVYSAMIGKSGANIRKMEEEYSVKFDILKTRNMLRIRGDADKITRARAAVLTFIDGTRVTDYVAVPSSFARKALESTIKATCDIYQLEIAASPEDPNKLVLKGTYAVVEEAKAHLTEHLTNRAVGSVSLLPKHVTAIGSRVAENFKRLHDKHHVTFSLDAAKSALLITGEAAAVSAAKVDAMKFLESFFPTEVHAMEVASFACMRDILGWDLVNEVVQFGAAVQVHRPINRLFLLSESNNALNAAKAVVQSKFNQWNDLHETVAFEEFMYAQIIGKNGSAIAALCKENQVTIDINRTTQRLEFTGATKQIVQDAKRVIGEKIEKLRSEHCEIAIPTDMVGFVIGKAGATINKIRSESGASVEFDDKGYFLKVSGAVEKIQKVKDMVREIIEAEEKVKANTAYVPVPAAAIPAIIGAKGASSKHIQTVSGVHLDVDRATSRCILKGSEEARAKATEMIKEILEQSGFNRVVPEPVAAPAPVPVPEPVKVEETVAAPAAAGGRVLKVMPGAPPEVVNRMNLSKSALKRLRKKENAGSAEAAEEEDEEVVPPAPAPKAAPVAAAPAPVKAVAVPAAAEKRAPAPAKVDTPPPPLESADEPIVFKPDVVVPIAPVASASSSSSATSALAGFPLKIGQLPSVSITSAGPAPTPAPTAAHAPAPVAPVAAAAPAPAPLAASAPPPGLAGPTPVSLPGFAMFNAGPPKAVGSSIAGLVGLGLPPAQPAGLGVIGRTGPAPVSVPVIPPRVNPAAPASSGYPSFEQSFDTIKISNMEIPIIANGSTGAAPASNPYYQSARGPQQVDLNLGYSAPVAQQQAAAYGQQAYGGYSEQQLRQQQQQMQFAQAQQQQQQYQYAQAQQQQMNYGRMSQAQYNQQVQQQQAAQQFNAKPSGMAPPGYYQQPAAQPQGNPWNRAPAYNNMYANTAATAAANNNNSQTNASNGYGQRNLL